MDDKEYIESLEKRIVELDRKLEGAQLDSDGWLTQAQNWQRKATEFEAQLATAQEHVAAQESIYQVALDSIEKLEAQLETALQSNDALRHKFVELVVIEAKLAAQLSQTWQPLPDGEYSVQPSPSYRLSVQGGDLAAWWSGSYDMEEINVGEFRLCRLVESQPQPADVLDKLEDIERKPQHITRAQFRALISTGWRFICPAETDHE